ncbi:hypothetical protein GQ600_950 [Phytophthora cactorum]|nr:hypothetical protein GQ600_950 [Phytophthora cactorum]
MGQWISALMPNKRVVTWLSVAVLSVQPVLGLAAAASGHEAVYK